MRWWRGNDQRTALATNLELSNTTPRPVRTCAHRSPGLILPIVSDRTSSILYASAFALFLPYFATFAMLPQRIRDCCRTGQERILALVFAAHFVLVFLSFGTTASATGTPIQCENEAFLCVAVPRHGPKTLFCWWLARR